MGLEYLDSFPLEKASLDYERVTYPFAISYPTKFPLGNTFVLAEVVGALADRQQKEHWLQILAERRLPDGLWAFDNNNFSIDADSTLTTLLTFIEERSLHMVKSGHLTIDTILNNFAVGCRYRSFHKAQSMAHPNFQAHMEVTANLLYDLVKLSKTVRWEHKLKAQCIIEAMLEDQLEDGQFGGYWYEPHFRSTFLAVRALTEAHRAGIHSNKRQGKMIERAISRARTYLLSPASEKAIRLANNEALALGWSTLSLLHAGTYLRQKDADSEKLSASVQWLMALQGPNGAWPSGPVFRYYYPNCADQSCSERWFDAQGVLATALALKVLNSIR